MNSGESTQDAISGRDVQSGEVGTTNNSVSERERELAREALAEFVRADFQACSAILEKLEALRPQDLKVTHNKIISDFYRSCEPQRMEILRKSLNAIDVVRPPNAQNSESEEAERSMLKYNQAVILFHSKKYRAALDIITGIFALNEPLEECFVHKICTILLEIHLILGKPDTAMLLVHFVENQFTSLPDSSKSVLGEQGQNQKHEGLIKANSKTTANLAAEKEQKKDSIDVAAEAFRIKLMKFKLRIYLKTLQVKLCKREWKSLVSLGMPTNLSTIFLKANLEYLRKNFKKAMKILNSINSETCPDFRSSGESIAVLYYNNIASLHFAMGKPHLACFYLKAALEENKKSIESVKGKKDANNSNSTDSSTQTTVPIHAQGKYKHYELMYSLGVSLLYTGQATKAFNCFIEASQVYYRNPRLWLRMAESCIMCHKSSNKVDFDVAAKRKDIVERVIGDNENGVSRKFVLASSLTKNCKYNSEGLSYAMPQLTLEYGMLCLKNALFLLPMAEKEDSGVPHPTFKTCIPQEEGLKKTSGNQPQTLLGSLSPNSQKIGNHNVSSSHIDNAPKIASQPSQCTITENLNLKISILAASSYISLCLGDYVVALEHAKSLLSIKNLPGAHWLLGNLYAAESLIFLDRIFEALEHLKLESLQDLSTYIPIGEVVGDKEKVVEEVIEQKPSKVSWYPSNIATAKSILRYNLAVAYAIRGELDKSGEILKQVWTSKGPDCDVPIHVIMLALYIELQLGNIDVARSLIKQHYCLELQQ
ncbi:hypothetical protein TSAR_016403 [Trichomalopsis sarcophagae]|uniref:CCR4-NOT transcription complex subunit 10 n=1 Tax=Trichomalopsis sarcophagae TaxID=543379 RepID=A0A232FL90_9HYME|nr:hypothetical protein TSAR_016403 [Trichomalopsis sarcophagae]